MDDPMKIAIEHFKERIESWAGMYLGLPPDHDFTKEDWTNLGQRLGLVAKNILDGDGLQEKLLQNLPDEKLDEVYAEYNKRLMMCRKEIARRHGG